MKFKTNRTMAEEIEKPVIILIDDIEVRRDMGRHSRENSYKYSKYNISYMWFEFLQYISSKQ